MHTSLCSLFLPKASYCDDGILHYCSLSQQVFMTIILRAFLPNNIGHASKSWEWLLQHKVTKLEDTAL